MAGAKTPAGPRSTQPAGCPSLSSRKHRSDGRGNAGLDVCPALLLGLADLSPSPWLPSDPPPALSDFWDPVFPPHTKVLDALHVTNAVRMDASSNLSFHAQLHTYVSLVSLPSRKISLEAKATFQMLFSLQNYAHPPQHLQGFSRGTWLESNQHPEKNHCMSRYKF